MTAVVIRADASRQIGWGHVKRCLALAQALQSEGATVSLVARDSDIDLSGLCTGAGVRLLRLPMQDGVTAGDDAGQTLGVLTTDARPALAVVDHYQLDSRWHDRLRGAGIRVAVIDDLANRPLAGDWLIDPNPASDHAAKYAAVIQAPVPRIFGGPRYALLDAAYATQPRRAFDATVHRIGICMGGTDVGGFSALAWLACRASGFAGEIEVVSTRDNPSLAALQSLVAGDARTTLQLDLPNLAAFHARQDLEIGAGGGTSWERCCLGVPTLALVCADNQLQALRPLADAGVACVLDLRSSSDQGHADRVHDQLTAAIRELLDKPDVRARQSRLGRLWVDGLGTQRVAQALLHPAMLSAPSPTVQLTLNPLPTGAP
jgi:UDP-2,4-diacetamido-2,4,6-trideoxy-beta-L-altropyranose hydrolase